MTLVRRPLDRNQIPLRNAMERLFGDWPLGSMQGGFTEVLPPLDVRETDDAYIVEVELPGVDPKDTEVSIEGRTVTIRGQFAEEQEREEGNFLLRERRRGQFMRAVALPGMVDVEKATSRYENGELTITLPKATQNRARRVEITSGDGRNGNGRSGNGRSGNERSGNERSGNERSGDEPQS
ncbi:MAG TPA: Hsp20/alpha crystallin family protein [Candidatus Limnocylindrales bacterium]|nr:Hsp20/alpha crystallin family protein [Candidatus Limnocylindrales bacterium]